MYCNILPNCYCYWNFYNCREFYSIPTSNCYPSYCCCCLICCHRNKPKLRKMPAKPYPTLGNGAASKNASKVRSKTVKAKRLSQNDNREEQKIKRESVSSQENKSLKTGKPLNSHHSLHSGSNSLRNSSSFNRSFLISGARLEKNVSRQKLNLNMAISSNPGTKYSYDSTETTHSKRSSASNQSRREQTNNFENMENSQSFVRNSLNMKNQPSCCSRIQPTRRCSCCNKVSPKNIGSPQTSRHSFSGTKTASQLDVIAEEDSDIDRNRRQCNSFEDFAGLDSFCTRNKDTGSDNTQRRCSNNENKGQRLPNVNKSKSLEDSCADFLNIVCDNIMESVQESVDSKLKVFGNQATEKFKCLRKKLEENEAAMKNFIQELTETITEQNKRNFEEFYLRIQELVEKQNQMKSNDSEDKEQERQFSEPEISEESVSNISEHFSNNADGTCESNENFVRCACCHCCFEVENFCHPCCPQEANNENAIHSHHQLREMGGCHDCETTNNAAGEVKLLESCAGTYQKTKSLNDSLTSQEFGLQQGSTLPTTLTNFCPTTSGKKTLKCNSSTHSHDTERDKMKSYTAQDKNINCNKKSNLKYNSSIDNENYDTSGYATEPEGSSEATVVNCGRKKFQKKSLRQHSANRLNSAGNPLEVFNNISTDIRDDVSARNSSQAIRRLSRSSLRSSVAASPTRLSRL